MNMLIISQKSGGSLDNVPRTKLNSRINVWGEARCYRQPIQNHCIVMQNIEGNILHQQAP
jgi:hypothetical protein